MPDSAQLSVSYFVYYRSGSRWRVKKACGQNVDEAHRVLGELGRNGLVAAIMVVDRDNNATVLDTVGGLKSKDTIVVGGTIRIF